MLSNENRNALTTTELEILYREAGVAARRLGQSLKPEHNPDYREREAPSPASGVEIRILTPRPPSTQIGFDLAECRRHNAMVANLGRMPR